jgi:hypothetical protein
MKMVFISTKKAMISMVSLLLILGGYYDDNFDYVPGKSWDHKNQCYKSELEEVEYWDYEDNGSFYIT